MERVTADELGLPLIDDADEPTPVVDPTDTTRPTTPKVAADGLPPDLKSPW